MLELFKTYYPTKQPANLSKVRAWNSWTCLEGVAVDLGGIEKGAQSEGALEGHVGRGVQVGEAGQGGHVGVTQHGHGQLRGERDGIEEALQAQLGHLVDQAKNS
eukprot:scaffold221018_cov48-Prasinocladus_malaysianus.AAC.3